MIERPSKFDYYLSYAGAVAAVAVLVVWGASTGNTIEPVAPVRANTWQCSVPGDSPGRSLQILTYSQEQARLIVDRLCRSEVVRADYEEIHATWHRREIDDDRLAFDQRFDLLLTRPGPIEKHSQRIVNAYVPIAVYGANTSRFISLLEQPVLSQQYLRSRTLGLLEAPDSLSGHVIPRRRMHNAGIDESDLTIRYYDDHLELYRALIDREVDVIATGIQLPIDDIPEQSHFALPIQSGVAGPKWFLHPRLVDTELHCLIERVLTELSTNASLAYEKSLRLLALCEL